MEKMHTKITKKFIIIVISLILLLIISFFGSFYLTKFYFFKDGNSNIADNIFFAKKNGWLELIHRGYDGK